MNYWSLKEIADNLNITYQAIYKNRDKYIKLGYMEKINGTYKINVQGYNYLLEKRKQPNISEPEAELKNNIQNDYIDLLKSRIEHLENELKEVKHNYSEEVARERERTLYFKNLFEQKDRQLTTYLLPGDTPEAPHEKNKSSFLDRLFNKK